MTLDELTESINNAIDDTQTFIRISKLSKREIGKYEVVIDFLNSAIYFINTELQIEDNSSYNDVLEYMKSTLDLSIKEHNQYEFKTKKQREKSRKTLKLISAYIYWIESGEFL